MTTEDSKIIQYDTKISGFFGSNRFLSNFWTCEVGIWWMGNKFPSVENAYQAAKFPRKYHKEFLTITAAQSKKMAKLMVKEDPSVFNKSQWGIIKLRIMGDLVFQKFNYDNTLEQMLVETKNSYLEETNSWHDYYWGVCEGQGENNLGKILMKVRSFWKDT